MPADPRNPDGVRPGGSKTVGKSDRQLIPGYGRVVFRASLILLAAFVYLVVQLIRTPPAADNSAPELQDKDQETVALKRVLVEMGEAVSNNDTKQLERLLDFDGMHAGMFKQGLMLRLAGVEADVVQGFKEEVLPKFSESGFLRNYARCEIRKVTLLPPTSEAIVYARHWNKDGLSFKYRWWLKKHSAGWRIIDFEDFAASIQLTSQLASSYDIVLSDPEQKVKKRSQRKRLGNAMRALAQGDVKTAKSELDSMVISGVNCLIRPYQARFWLCKSQLDLLRGNPSEALRYLDKAETLNNDLLQSKLLRAMILVQEKKYADVRQMALAHIMKVGPDAEGYGFLGLAVAELGLRKEEAEAYRKALDEDPDYVSALISLALTLPNEQKTELADRIARMIRPAHHIKLIGSELLSVQDFASLAVILPAYAKLKPDDRYTETLRAQIKAARNSTTRECGSGAF